MDTARIVDAWRDLDAYWALSEQERAEMPTHPAGTVTTPDLVLEDRDTLCTLHSGGAVCCC